MPMGNFQFLVPFPMILPIHVTYLLEYERKHQSLSLDKQATVNVRLETCLMLIP